MAQWGEGLPPKLDSMSSTFMTHRKVERIDAHGLSSDLHAHHGISVSLSLSLCLCLSLSHTHTHRDRETERLSQMWCDAPIILQDTHKPASLKDKSRNKALPEKQSKR